MVKHWDDPRAYVVGPNPPRLEHPDRDPEGATSGGGGDLEALCRSGRFTRAGCIRTDHQPDERVYPLTQEMIDRSAKAKRGTK